MKLFFFILTVLFCNVVTAQSRETSGKYDKIGKFNKGLALVHKHGLVGAIDTTGKEIIPPVYERISAFNKGGVAYTYRNGLVGRIKNDGDVMVVNLYDYIGHFKDGYATARKHGLTGIIDTCGNVVIEIKYQKLVCESGGVFKATVADGREVLVKRNR